MHVCVCLHTHVCVPARVPAHVGTRVCICVHIYVHTAAHVCCAHMWCTAICTCMCMCLCVCVCTCAFMSACLCVYTCLYVFLHMYVCMHVCVCMRACVHTWRHVCACTECAPPSPHAEMTPPPPSLSAAPFISQRPHPLAFLLENHSPVPPVLSAQAGPWPHMQLCGWLLPVVLEPGWGLEGRRPATTWDCHRPRPWGPLSDGVPSVAGGCLRGGLWTGH